MEELLILEFVIKQLSYSGFLNMLVASHKYRGRQRYWETSATQPTHGAESRSPPWTTLVEPDIIAPLCEQQRNDLFLNWNRNWGKQWERKLALMKFKECNLNLTSSNLIYPRKSRFWQVNSRKKKESLKIITLNVKCSLSFYTAQMEAGDGTEYKCIFVANTCKMLISLLTSVKGAIEKDRNKSASSS